MEMKYPDLVINNKGKCNLTVCLYYIQYVKKHSKS